MTKTRVDDLAIFGGMPEFREPMHVGRPNLGNREALLRRINDLLDRRWLSNNGPFVAEFERRIAEFVGVKNCIAVCNGTIALELAIRALGLSGEVILPSMTFVATAHALQWHQITPVFCDIDDKTFTIDPSRLEELITPRTTGIIGVHLWGRACNVECLADIAARRGLKLLYDAAHAFACSKGGQRIGSFGHAEVFSFHATKFFNTFEGGAVLTNDDELADRIRLMRNFGFAGYDKVVSIGINGKMTEVCAAMGLTGLESLDEFIAANRRNYIEYVAALADLEGAQVARFDDGEAGNYQYIVLEIDEATGGLTRDTLAQVLWAENVLARRYFYPGCHRMEPYRSLYPAAGERLAVTERALDRVLTVPTGTAVTPVDVRRICDILRFAVRHSSEIRGRLQSNGGGSCETLAG
jgi:dTDP-4-amino-4,6-dideoxygalactose transaminase